MDVMQYKVHTLRRKLFKDNITAAWRLTPINFMHGDPER